LPPQDLVLRAELTEATSTPWPLLMQVHHLAGHRRQQSQLPCNPHAADEAVLTHESPLQLADTPEGEKTSCLTTAPGS
jgi:hypothetical protein